MRLIYILIANICVLVTASFFGRSWLAMATSVLALAMAWTALLCKPRRRL